MTWEPQVTLQSGIASGSLKATLDLIRFTFAGDEEIQFIYGLANGDIYRKRIDTPTHKADYDDALHWTSELVYVSGQEPRSHAVLLHPENISAEVAIVYQTQAHYIQMLFWNGLSWEAASPLSTHKRRRHSATWDTQNHQIHAFVEGNIASGHSDILRSVFTIATRSWGPEEVVINDRHHDMERPDPIRVTQDGSIFLVADNNSRDARAAWNVVGTPSHAGPRTVHCGLGEMTEWFRNQLASNDIDWVSSTFQVALVDDTYVFDVTQDQDTDVIEKQVGTQVMLSGQEVDQDDSALRVRLDAHDVVFSSVAIDQIAAGAVVMNDNHVVGHCNFADVVTNGNDIIVQFASSGVFQF